MTYSDLKVWPNTVKVLGEAIEERVVADYRAVLGTVVAAREVAGYEGEDSVFVECDPPALVKVLPTRHADLLRWNDDWCDPYWDVELVAPHPELEGVRSLWIDGPSYQLIDLS